MPCRPRSAASAPTRRRSATCTTRSSACSPAGRRAWSATPTSGHDFATEAFVKLLRNWGEVSEPKAWLYTATANLIKDHWRKRGREHAAYERFGGVADHVDASDVATSLSVRTAVLALPERLRVPVMLHYFGDLTIAQVAAHLGKAEGTIKRDLWDARGRLAALLEDAR